MKSSVVSLLELDKLQLDKRKKEVAQIYNLAAEGYDLSPLSFFSLSAGALVKFAQPAPGQLILDVGTGTGVTALMAAKRCAPTGQVVGIDIAEEMLRIAAYKAEAAQMLNLEFQFGDAENLDFAANTFDLVLSTASLFFLPDMGAGLKEWRRVCKPGGMVAISGFGMAAFQPLSDMFETHIRGYGITFPVQRPFSWQRLTTPGQYWELLKQSGYTQIQIHTTQLGYYLKGVDEWWQIIWNSGFRGPVAKLSSDQLENFKDEHLAQVAKLVGSSGIWLDLPVICATGQKI